MPREYFIYRLRIQLDDVDPPIWRELFVDAGITLRQLHHILQVAFGWESTHEHYFKISRATYRELPKELPPTAGSKLFSDHHTKLSAVAKEKQKFSYVYGRHEEWTHRITVKMILSNDETLGRAILDAGQLNGPTEHCEGPLDYTEFLTDYIAKMRVPQPGDPIEGMFRHGRFDPLYCDRRSINSALARLAQTGGAR